MTTEGEAEIKSQPFYEEFEKAREKGKGTTHLTSLENFVSYFLLLTTPRSELFKLGIGGNNPLRPSIQQMMDLKTCEALVYKDIVVTYEPHP